MARRRNSNDERLSVLSDLLRQPANKECADCGAPGPRWASWSIGVFLCINCAGIHRSLGTHITKVKSATLDKWTDDQIQNIQSVGNAKAKLIYEANVPTGVIIPRYGASSHQLESWIRAKYERKLYMNRKANNYSSDNSYETQDSEERRLRKERRRKERQERKAREQTARTLTNGNNNNSNNRQINGNEPLFPPPPSSSSSSSSGRSTAVSAPQSQPAISLFPSSINNNTKAPTSAPSPAINTFDFNDQTAKSKLDKDSIMSLYRSPMAPSMMMAPPPAYNASHSGGYGSTLPMNQIHYQNMGMIYQQQQQQQQFQQQQFQQQMPTNYSRPMYAQSYQAMGNMGYSNMRTK